MFSILHMIIFTLFRLSTNAVFRQIWTNTGLRQLRDKQTTLSDSSVLKKIWKKSYTEWKDLCASVKNGTVKYFIFERYWKESNCGNIQSFVSLMSNKIDENWIDDRIKQYRDLKLMTQCSKAANIILKIVEEFDLKGDFTSIQSLSGTVEHITNFDNSE